MDDHANPPSAPDGTYIYDAAEEQLYRQAVCMVLERQRAAANLLQRWCDVENPTANRWLERMEAEGLIGPPNHVAIRKIFRDAQGNPK